MFLAPTLEKPKENQGFGPLRPRSQGQGCASRARNSKGPIPRLGHRKNIEKIDKNMEYGMNQGLVCPFEPKLCQDVATASPNPLECLRTLKTIQNQKNPRFLIFPPFPP